MNIKLLISRIKKNDIFEVIKHTLNYFGANIATKALGFISIPVFTRLLSIEDYGIFNIYMAYANIFTVVLTLNSYTSVSRYFYEEKEDFKEFVGTSILVSLICLFFSLSLFMQFTEEISFYSKLNKYLVILIIPNVFINVINSIFVQIMSCQKKSKVIAVSSIVQSYFGFIISVILIVFFLDNQKYLGNIYGYLITASIMSIYFILRIKQYCKVIIIVKHIKYIINYSIPLIPYALSAVILEQFDRIMVGTINGANDAGLYSLAYNVGMLVIVFASSVQAAVVPDFFRLINNKEYERVYSLDKKTFSIILIVALGLICYSTELVKLLADAKFHSSLSIVPIIIIGYVFFALSNVYTRYIGYEKRTVWLAVILLIAGIVNILLNMVFLPIYGYEAAAYTTLISYFFMLSLAWIVAKMAVKLPVTPINLFLPEIVLFFIFVWIYYLGNTLNIYPLVWFLMKLLLIILYCAVTFRKQLKNTN